MARRWIAIATLVGVASLVLSSGGRALAQSEPVDAGTRVYRYLRGLNLDSLAAVQLENDLRAARDPQRRAALARETGDLYAELLTAPGLDEQELGRRMASLDRLVEAFPEIDSPALAIIRLQGEFKRGEEALDVWIADPKQESSLATAKSVFDRIGPELAAAALRLDGERREAQGKLDAADGPSPDLERRFERVSEAWNRANYFAGWAEYYRWLVSDRSGNEALVSSVEAFERFLGLVGESYADVKPEWLALEVKFRATGTIGLELALLGLGDRERADHVHQWLQHFSVAASTRDELPNWRLTGLLNARAWNDAVQFAETTIAGFSPQPTQGKVTFCVTLLRGAYAMPGVPDDARKRFAELGIERLARMRVFNVLDELIERYEIDDAASSQRFYLQFLAAKRAFEAAEASKKPEDYDLAIQAFQNALDEPEAKQDLAARGDLLYSMGHALYKRDKLKEAAETFEGAWKALRDTKSDSTDKAAWMAFVAYNELGKTDKSYYDAALSALERLAAELPDTEYGKRARANLPRLRSMASPPAEALATWKKVPPTDAKYEEAQREIARLYGRMAFEAKTAAQRAKIADEAAAFVDSALGSKDVSSETKAEIAVLGSRLAAVADPPDWNRVAATADRAANVVSSLPPSSSTARDWHSLRMSAAAKLNDDDRARREAAWLTENAAGTPQARAALVMQARRGSDWGLSSDRLDEIYERIADGATSTTLTEDPNARVAQYRLARKAEKSGDLEEAEKRLALLLKAYPDERAYLLLQSRILFARKKFAESRELSLKLLRGLDSDDERWWEAKYLQIAALAQTDPAGAAKVYAQFRLLYPEIPDAALRERFDELDARLKSR